MQRREFITSALAASTFTDHIEQNGDLTPTKPFTVKAGEARFGIYTPYRQVNTNDVKVSGKDTNEQLAVFEYIGRVKAGPTLHVHHEQDEIFSIIEGEYFFQIGTEQFTAKAGDTVFAPRGIPHTWIQLSEQGKQVYMVQPAGQLEAFFYKMNELKEPPTEALAQKMHQAHGMTVLRPPLTLK
ncbi:hypothetical protein GCM10027341_09770 [Spirosoma knui]